MKRRNLLALALASPVAFSVARAQTLSSGDYRQMQVGRDEPILEPDIPIIDAHHHLVDRPGLRYMIDDYLADARAGHRVVASVYVETLAFARTDGPEVLRPLGEIEFANGIGAMCDSGRYGCRGCAAIVGHADLRLGDQVAELLDRAMERAPDRFRGVRQVTIEDPSEAPYRFIPTRPPSGVMKSAGFRPAFAHLARRGLSFDAAVFHHQLPEVIALADAFPDTTIVLNHCGHAMAMDLDAPARERVFREYRRLMTEAARRPNIHCKVGGLGMPFWGFRLEERKAPIGYRELAAAWRPYVETAIEAFGADRCLMESNYPPDGRSAGFVPLWNALKYIVRSASADEKAALFLGTAAKVYRMRVSVAQAGKSPST
ncbi:putative TIM-barrel fold metal-dependent hydrolase [Delftia sp. 60]|uniref:amidohydrolase family protein n=1 Tax=Delftia sp. 60 TaxID=2035216 RepID=UPI000C174B82|nr:amidohydrolase family protein [Delftia sp. 60]PIF37587.1 putative TIM-barrel fold metal-dependent hydrolase [Burkholderiales bacterium 23]PIF67231.1 putative TIM-barrel fold metal-dependent hydrolase [Delftia sp. 60]